MQVFFQRNILFRGQLWIVYQVDPTNRTHQNFKLSLSYYIIFNHEFRLIVSLEGPDTVSLLAKTEIPSQCVKLCEGQCPSKISFGFFKSNMLALSFRKKLGENQGQHVIFVFTAGQHYNKSVFSRTLRGRCSVYGHDSCQPLQSKNSEDNNVLRKPSMIRGGCDVTKLKLSSQKFLVLYVLYILSLQPIMGPLQSIAVINVIKKYCHNGINDFDIISCTSMPHSVTRNCHILKMTVSATSQIGVTFVLNCDHHIFHGMTQLRDYRLRTQSISILSSTPIVPDNSTLRRNHFSHRSFHPMVLGCPFFECLHRIGQRLLKKWKNTAAHIEDAQRRGVRYQDCDTRSVAQSITRLTLSLKKKVLLYVANWGKQRLQNVLLIATRVVILTCMCSLAG